MPARSSWAIVAPVAAGDYAAGPSHVLPTGGTARWASGLSANDFLKRSSLIALSRDGLAALAPDIRLLADKEGLTAHRLSVDFRLDGRTANGEDPVMNMDDRRRLSSVDFIDPAGPSRGCRRSW